MDESHSSLRDLYEVSSPELDVLVEAAQGVEGVLGARMTGAGFGGCAVALVHEDAISEVERRVGREYQARTGRAARFYVCQVTDGAAEV
jgi:galactokinase